MTRLRGSAFPGEEESLFCWRKAEQIQPTLTVVKVAALKRIEPEAGGARPSTLRDQARGALNGLSSVLRIVLETPVPVKAPEEG